MSSIDARDIRWELAPVEPAAHATHSRLTADADALAILGHGEAQLLERVVDLSIERDAYRTLAQQTIHALADLQQRYDRQRAQYLRLLAACRTLRTTRRAA